VNGPESFRLGHWSPNRSPLLVAEIGNNHEGDMGRARELVDAAAASGADAVKLQVFHTELYVRPIDEARFRARRRFELRPDEYNELLRRARGLGLLVMATPFDCASAEALEEQVDALKIASGDITFLPLLRLAAGFPLPLVLSTGASTRDEIDSALAEVRNIRGAGHERLALLHCVAGYPTPEEQAHLAAIPYLRRCYPELVIGYSDHTEGIAAAVLAVAAGARIIEKHFTLSRAQSDHPDHRISADPAGMKELSRRLRQVHEMRGEESKDVQPCEAEMPARARRSIATACELKKGETIEMKHLCWLRPACGAPPGHEERFLGRRVKEDIPAGTILLPEHLDG